jgi:hypothetical protein
MMPMHHTILNDRRHVSSTIHNRNRQLEEKTGLLLAQAKTPSSLPQDFLLELFISLEIVPLRLKALIFLGNF